MTGLLADSELAVRPLGSGGRFRIEVAGAPAGQGLVEPVALAGIEQASRRIEVELAPAWRGQGLGRRTIRLLTAHAFASGAGAVFALGVDPGDRAARRALAANCYVPWGRGGLICRRDYFEGRAPVRSHPGPDGVMAGDDPGGCMIVVHRRVAGGLELLLLHRAAEGPDHEGDWAWTPPSGPRFPAEPPEECAVRELHEETGLGGMLRCLPGVGTDAWWVYALEVAPGVAAVTDAEHDRLEWVAAEEAIVRCRPAAVRDSLAQAVGALG